MVIAKSLASTTSRTKEIWQPNIYPKLNLCFYVVAEFVINRIYTSNSTSPDFQNYRCQPS